VHLPDPQRKSLGPPAPVAQADPPVGCHGDTVVGRGLESQVRLEPVCRTPIVGAARTVLSEVFRAGVMSGGGAGEGHEA
jgi:hypothetical protein